MDNLEFEVLEEINVDIEKEIEIEVEIQAMGPQGKDGKSAYEIYIKNGGILTEIEWIASLKGEPGASGKDGKSPVLGEDYWTEKDKNDIKNYCDNYIEEQLGVIENAYY